MTWNPLDEPMDRIWLNQVWSPGIAEIAGASSPRKWDVADGHGLSGATSVFGGVGLSRFEVRIRLYTAQDWIAWSLFKPLVDKPPIKKKPLALDIWHPVLVDQGIYAVDVEDVGQPEQTADGEWTIAIKMIEHRAPKAALAKPKGSKATPVDPDPLEAKIEERTKTVTKKLGELGLLPS